MTIELSHKNFTTITEYPINEITYILQFLHSLAIAHLIVFLSLVSAQIEGCIDIKPLPAVSRLLFYVL